MPLLLNQYKFIFLSIFVLLALPLTSGIIYSIYRKISRKISANRLYNTGMLARLLLGYSKAYQMKKNNVDSSNDVRFDVFGCLKECVDKEHIAYIDKLDKKPLEEIQNKVNLILNEHYIYSIGLELLRLNSKKHELHSRVFKAKPSFKELHCSLAAPFTSSKKLMSNHFAHYNMKIQIGEEIYFITPLLHKVYSLLNDELKKQNPQIQIRSLRNLMDHLFKTLTIYYSTSIHQCMDEACYEIKSYTNLHKSSKNYDKALVQKLDIPEEHNAPNTTLNLPDQESLKPIDRTIR